MSSSQSWPSKLERIFIVFPAQHFRVSAGWPLVSLFCKNIRQMPNWLRGWSAGNTVRQTNPRCVRIKAKRNISKEKDNRKATVVKQDSGEDSERIVSGKGLHDRLRDQGVSMSARISGCLWRCRVNCLVAALVTFLLLPTLLVGQVTISSGSVQGTVTDPTGSVVVGARITITGKETGQTLHVTTTSAGVYASGPLTPGSYVVRVETEGFKITELTVTVQVGVTSSGNIRLQLGEAKQIIEVKDSDVQVNTEQATLQGVLTTGQIEQLPINGRDFIDLAQLEPGVQTQDVADSTETHLSRAGISVGGRYSAGTVVEIDGVDMSDGTGNSLGNISASSIQEFSITQSSADPSNETSDSGGVNIVTRTGSNAVHGEGLYLFRDRSLAANFPGGVSSPYQRHDFAGNVGGPIIKDRLFFFASGERYKQDLGFPVNVAPPLQDISSVVPEPLRSSLLSGRLDYIALRGARLFYRFNYDNTKTVGAFQPTFALQREVDNTPSHAVGVDFTTGRSTHSFRFGYAKNQVLFGDATSEPGVYNPLGNVTVNFGRGFHAGPDANQPQKFYHSNEQIKYDGSHSFSAHVFRYGFAYTRIQKATFVPFALDGPVLKSQLIPTNIAIAAAGPFPGGSGNPLNYPVAGNLSIQIGNGEGFLTEIPGFNQKGGAFPTDNRIQWYVGDTWKVKPYLTLNYSLRYARDTGILDTDLAPIPCSTINTSVFSPAPPCTGNLLDMFGTGLSARPRQDNNNFAPQVGLAWDLFKNGKTVLRAGAGLFYATSIYQGNRPELLSSGLFSFTANSDTGEGCNTGLFRFPVAGGGFTPVTRTPSTAAHPGGLDIATQVCGQPIGSVGEDVFALAQAYKAAWTAAGPQANPNFVGNTLAPSLLYAPNYRTPYSYQINVGVQHEISKGTIFSADYVRSLSLHYAIGIDTNHVGDSRYLNKTAALNAINGTNASFGCPAGTAGIQCSIAAGATMEDFAGNGLTSTTNFLGAPPSAFGLTPDFGAAFAGINPNVAQGLFYYPIGRAVYNALQVSLRQRVDHPLPFTKGMNLQFSYALSRYENPLQATNQNTDDQTAGAFAGDYRNPLAHMGPSSFDRTHQFSLGTVIDVSKGLRVAVIAHVKSPLSQTMNVPDQGRAGEIFYTDFTGDGTTGDILPGTRVGSFGRDIKASSLSSFLNKYNGTVAGMILPAGQALIDAGLFTKDQLVALGAVADSIPLGPTSDRAAFGWLKTIDLKLSWPLKIGERFVLEPSAAAYNLFNFVNYDINPGARLSGVLDGAPGAVNGTTNSLSDRAPERAGQGPGVFSLGTARQFEFGMKLTF